MKITDLKPGDVFWMEDSQAGSIWKINTTGDKFGLVVPGKTDFDILIVESFANREVELINQEEKSMYTFNKTYLCFPIKDNAVLTGLVRDRLIELGYRDNNNVASSAHKSGLLSVSESGRMYHTGWEVFPKGDKYHEIGDLNKLFFTDEYSIKSVEVKLNKDYTAKILKDRIEVGCQSFTFEKFQELVDAVNKVKENKNVS